MGRVKALITSHITQSVKEITGDMREILDLLVLLSFHSMYGQFFQIFRFSAMGFFVELHEKMDDLGKIFLMKIYKEQLFKAFQ